MRRTRAKFIRSYDGEVLATPSLPPADIPPEGSRIEIAKRERVVHRVIRRYGKTGLLEVVVKVS